MIDINMLKGKIIAAGYTQQDMAEKLGVTSKTFYSKMKKGVFDSDEICQMVEICSINREEAAEIFFAPKVRNAHQVEAK